MEITHAIMSYRFAVIMYLSNNLWKGSILSSSNKQKKHVYTNIVIFKETKRAKA